jgi:large subunit ribosomal protein L30e
MTEEEIQEEVEQKEEPKKVKVKKVVRRRKTKKERENPLTVAIRLAVESGSVEFGAKASMSSSGDRAKLLVVANNIPDKMKTEVESFAKTSKVPLITFEGSSMDLGSVCGKPFPVSVLSVYKEGSSNILELVK